MVDDLKTFTKRAKDVLATAAITDRMKYLDFLNVSEQTMLEQMARKVDDVNVVFDGGFESAERRRAVVVPIYIPTESLDFKVSLFKIEVIGSGMVTNSQVMGALMALNIDRSVIGDISVTSDDTVDGRGAFFAACSEFDAFLTENFTKAGPHAIRLTLIKEKVARAIYTEELEIIVSSMRLDVVVKALINASRGKAEEYLEAGFVRHNHVLEKKVSRTCRVGDVLSIRKQGRFKIIENKKTTKSGKFVLVVSKSV